MRHRPCKSSQSSHQRATVTAPNPEHTVRRPKPFKKKQRTLNPISPARLKGERSEKLVLEILVDLIRRCELPAATEKTLRYPDNSDQDKAGYDISYLTDFGRIDLQVKSSWRSREKFLHKRPNIICIVVEDPGQRSVVEAQLKADIWPAYRDLQNKI